MKKSVLLLCAMLSSSLAFAQGAEEEETTTQILFIPRLDLNPTVALGENAASGFNLGNSSLYTLFEGNIGNSNFSYSVEGHWLGASADEIRGLYSNTFVSTEMTWLDWANISYTLGSFDFTIGKDALSIGTFEIDEYDYNSFSALSSTAWNNLQVYQWGAKVGWTSPEEGSHVALQFASSPFGTHPFHGTEHDPALFAYSLQYTGEYGDFSTISSFNMLEYQKGSFVNCFAIGLKYTIAESFDLGVDWITRACGGENLFGSEAGVTASVCWNPSDNFSLMLKGGYEYNRSGEDIFGWNPLLDGEDPLDYFVPASLALIGRDYGFGGAVATWYPLHDLRVHGAIAANNWSKSLSINVGATWFFDLRKFIKR